MTIGPLLLSNYSSSFAIDYPRKKLVIVTHDVRLLQGGYSGPPYRLMKLIFKIWWSQVRKRWVVLGIALLLSLLTSIVLHLPGAAQRYIYQRWQESASL